MCDHLILLYDATLTKSITAKIKGRIWPHASVCWLEVTDTILKRKWLKMKK